MVSVERTDSTESYLVIQEKSSAASLWLTVSRIGQTFDASVESIQTQLIAFGESELFLSFGLSKLCDNCLIQFGGVKQNTTVNIRKCNK